jgi:hypothetical protein
MSHNYLLDTYKFIELRLESARAAASLPGVNRTTRKIAEGRINTLKEFQVFLHGNYDCKLPRRIYNHFLTNRERK